MSSGLHVPSPRIGEEIRPMEGVKAWRNRHNGFLVVEIHYTADPARRGQWKNRTAPNYGGLRSWRWLKEQEIDWEAQSGRLIFETFDEEVHGIEPIKIPTHWPRWVMWDPGWSNPNSVLWVAVNVDAEMDSRGFLPIHVYREFYEPKRDSKEIARLIFRASGGDTEKDRAPDELVEAIIVDPGARQEHQSAAKGGGAHVSPEADTVLKQFREEIESLGWDVPVTTGINAKTEALLELIRRVGNFWCSFDGEALFDQKNAYRLPTESELLDGAFLVQPTIFMHRQCRNTIQEAKGYRWSDWTSQEVEDRRNTPEKPVDKDDHSMTNLIRLMNHLQELRGDPDDEQVELKMFRSRFRHRSVKSPEQVAQDYHRGAAGRFRNKATGG